VNSEGFIHALAVSGTNIFAGTGYAGVLLSTNNGKNWSKTGLTKSVNGIVINGVDIFMLCSDGVFLSTDDGTSWTAVNEGLPSSEVTTLVSSGTNIFTGTHDKGVFLSTNNGSNWTAVNTGLTDTWVVSLAVSGTNLFAGGSGDDLFRSTNNGTSWTQVGTGLPNREVTVLVRSGSDLFAGTWYGGIFRSTNNGTSWTAVNTEMSNYGVRSLALFGTNLFAGTDHGVFLSTNNGTSWNAVNTGLTDYHAPAYLGSVLNVMSLAVDGNVLFAGTGAGIFRADVQSLLPAQIISLPEPLNEYVMDLQRNPNDDALREKIIKLAQAMKPAPTIPEEARKHFVMGTALFKDAKTPDDCEQVSTEFNQAIFHAPWWKEAYYNLALTYEAAGKYNDAIAEFKLYQLFELSGEETRTLQDNIYALDAKQEKAESRLELAAEKAKKLVEAAEEGDYGAVSALLDKGIDVNAKTPSGGDALGTAVFYGKVDVVRLLINRGAKIENDILVTAVNMLGSHNPKVLQLLIDKGANVHVNWSDNTTLLEYLMGEQCTGGCEENRLEDIRIFRNAGAK